MVSDDALTAADLLANQRRRSARAIGITLVALDLLTIVSVAVTTQSMRVLLVLGVAALATIGATLGILAGRVQTGIFLLIAINLLKHVLVVVALRNVSILPLFACVMVMLAAATLGSRRIVWVLAMSLATIGIETILGVHYGGTYHSMLPGVLGGVVLTVAAAVISILHVGQTERAFTLAAERERQTQAATLEARASEERHRLIADGTDDLIALVDQDGKAEYLSSSYQRCVGLTIEPAGKASILAAVHEEERTTLLDVLRKAREGGHATAVLRFGVPGNDYRTYEVRVSRVARENRESLAVIGRDVTVRLALEDRVRKAQRMEALDRLARGIAHDFNNLLSVMAGATDLIDYADSASPEIQRDLGILRQSLKSARGLTQQLLLFSRKQVAPIEIIDAAEVLRSLKDLIERLVGAPVRLTLSAAEGPLPINLPRSQLEQVVMNFAANARDAMPNGGRLTLSAAARRIEAGQVGDLSAGDYVEIAANDTGTGIQPDILPHLFEPFFTTKAASRGTGLGLATSYGIARQAGGTIAVETRMGEGSTFRAFFPVSAGSTAKVDESPVPSRSVPGRRVLVVDDNPEMNTLMARMLESAGFTVAMASTLADAERMLWDPSGTFDVLVTELMVGTERGTTLVPRVRAQWPRMRIVLVSGYTPNPEEANALLGNDTAFLAKPFDRAALLTAIGGSPSPTPNAG